MSRPWEERGAVVAYLRKFASDAWRVPNHECLDTLLEAAADIERGDHVTECDRDRARLAAAAPEMARALLSLEWAGCEAEPYDGCSPACPACGAPAPRTIHFPALRAALIDVIEAHDKVYGGEHRDDCRLVAVLRRAGVLP